VQNSIVHLCSSRPAADASIRLNHFPQWVVDCAFNPLISNHSTVRALAGVAKELCYFNDITSSLQENSSLRKVLVYQRVRGACSPLGRMFGCADLSIQENPLARKLRMVIHFRRLPVRVWHHFKLYSAGKRESVDHEMAGRGPEIGERAYARSPISGYSLSFREVLRITRGSE
jgi:hypothetical protein